MNEYIKSDMYRYEGKTGFFTFIKLYCDRTFRWQVAHRLCNGNGFERCIGIVLWACNRTRKYTIQIPRKTRIGYGLYIGHGGPVICNPTAVIGDNCNLSQWVTIGTNGEQAAHIGNNVYIGPSCCIVEDVKIGDNVTIGAGSVVTKDIPDNATAAGNYAKVLNYNNPGRFIENRWEH
ncbi:serine O-acetyltransferase [Lachnospiraceae bacterium XBB2008]|nr:serine O-acetyltransferase [Lachnospiraceae bacterium XBB2008]